MKGDSYVVFVLFLIPALIISLHVALTPCLNSVKEQSAAVAQG